MFQLDLPAFSLTTGGGKLPIFQIRKTQHPAPLFLFTPREPLVSAEIINSEKALGLTISLFEIDPFADLNLRPAIFTISALGYLTGSDRTKTILITKNGFELIVPTTFTSNVFTIEAFYITQIIAGRGTIPRHPDAVITSIKSNGTELNFTLDGQDILVDLPNGLAYLDLILTIEIVNSANFYPVEFWLLRDTFDVGLVTIDAKRYEPLLDSSPVPRSYRYNPHSSILTLYH